MRTTLDIPDDLFKQAKLKAVHEGVSLKVIFTRALEREIAIAVTDADARKWRAERLFASLDKARNEAPVGQLNREELYDRPVLRRH
jgi:hypothetical protein